MSSKLFKEVKKQYSQITNLNEDYVKALICVSRQIIGEDLQHAPSEEQKVTIMVRFALGALAIYCEDNSKKGLTDKEQDKIKMIYQVNSRD